MDILGIDISKRSFDVALLQGERVRQAVFLNTKAGFAELEHWLARHRPDRDTALHACMEATGNYGLDLAAVLHERGMIVSIVNPSRIKAHGQSELIRNKTDKLDAALIARFCRAHQPVAWIPPAAHLRELRELTRRCDALKAMRVQEINRQKSGMASAAVAASVAAHLNWLEQQVEEIMAAVRLVVASDRLLTRNHALLLTIPGIGPVTAATILVETSNIAEFTPERLGGVRGPNLHRSTAPERRSAARVGSAAWGRNGCGGYSAWLR